MSKFTSKTKYALNDYFYNLQLSKALSTREENIQL